MKKHIYKKDEIRTFCTMLIFSDISLYGCFDLEEKSSSDILHTDQFVLLRSVSKSLCYKIQFCGLISSCVLVILNIMRLALI